jgi:hypothetical protein
MISNFLKIFTAKYGRIGIGFELHKKNIFVAKKRMKQLDYNSKYKTIYYYNNKLIINEKVPIDTN